MVDCRFEMWLKNVHTMINSCSQICLLSFLISKAWLSSLTCLCTARLQDYKTGFSHPQKNKRNGKWLFLRSLVSLTPNIYCYIVPPPPNQQLPETTLEDWRLVASDQTSHLRSLLLIWSLLICHKCMSALLRMTSSTAEPLCSPPAY